MTVSISKYPNLKDALDNLGGLKRFVKKNQKVFIKPNICCTKKKAVTDINLIEKLILLLKPITKNIQIGDSSFSEFKTFEAMKATGIYQLAKKHNIKPVDLTNEKKVKVKSFIISKPILDADIIINMPKMKTHELAGVTLCAKNMMGIIPGHLKTNLHKQGLEKRIIELNNAVKPALNIVDANIGMEGRGPVNGKEKKVGLIIAGDNNYAVDAVCCNIMSIDPNFIIHLKNNIPKNINIIGWKDRYIKKFELPITYKNWLFRFGLKHFGERFRAVIEKGKIEFDYSKCIKCGKCIRTCPAKALRMGKQGPVIDHKKCIHCFCCFETCMPDAIKVKSSKIINVLKKLGGFKNVQLNKKH